MPERALGRRRRPLVVDGAAQGIKLELDLSDRKQSDVKLWGEGVLGTGRNKGKGLKTGGACFI